jgi:2-iminobutanoate/2-iminopropanoate deaminase
MRGVVTAALLATAVATGLAAQEREVLKVPGTVEGLPFSPAVKVGNIIYLSGQIGNHRGTRSLVSGGIRAETQQALENIRAVLEASGSSLDRVIKCTVYLADIGDYDAMNQVYATVFPKDPPARSTIATSGLALDARTEIECMATARPK